MSNSILTKLSAEIKRLRNKRGLSQAGLSKLSGVQQATISLIERSMGNPTVETIDRLLAALKK